MTEAKAKTRKKSVRAEPATVNHMHPNGSARIDRIISVVNLIATALLAMAAMRLGYLYNHYEQLDRDLQNQRESRRDTEAAQRQMATAIENCLQYNIDLSRQQAVDPNPLVRVALAQQIAYFAIGCRQIGRPLDERIAELALARLSSGTEPATAQASQRALDLIRRQRSAPPPTLREKADAYRALGGRSYYLQRGELEIPLGDTGGTGLRPSVIVDVGAVWRIREPAPSDQASTQPPDRFYAEEPRLRGFDLRGIGPRVSRAPYPTENQSEAFNTGTAF